MKTIVLLSPIILSLIGFGLSVFITSNERKKEFLFNQRLDRSTKMEKEYPNYAPTEFLLSGGLEHEGKISSENHRSRKNARQLDEYLMKKRR